MSLSCLCHGSEYTDAWLHNVNRPMNRLPETKFNEIMSGKQQM